MSEAIIHNITPHYIVAIRVLCAIDRKPHAFGIRTACAIRLNEIKELQVRIDEHFHQSYEAWYSVGLRSPVQQHLD